MTESSFLNLIKKKNVVFITVKNKDYIRDSQIERLLEKEALSFRVYSSEKKNPITRALDLRKRLKYIDLSFAEVVVLGFLPQLLYKKVLEKISGSKNSPVIVSDFFLSLYDTVVLDRKLVRDGFIVANMLRKLDKQVLEGSKLILTDTGANADFLSSLYDIPRDRFEIMYLEADSSLYYRIDVQSRNEKFSVLYFGTGLPLQGTDTVLEAFIMAAEKGIKCTYIGSLKGVNVNILRQAGTSSCIELIKWLPQKELAKKIAEADLCIAGHFNLYIDKAARTIPGKAYIYEAMGKPMILGDTKANHELFEEDERHIFAKRGDAADLLEKMLVQAKKWAF